MKNKGGKKVLIAGQIFIILAFFVGMMINYYLIKPVVDTGETWRLAVELDEFCAKFFPDNGCDISDRAQVDSIARTDPYYNGDLLIMDPEGRILYSDSGASGDGYEYLSLRYGKKAVSLVQRERNNPSGKSKMDYIRKSTTDLYASYEPTRNMLFFYAVDSHVAAEDVFLRYYALLAFMLIVGTVLIVICYLVVRGNLRRAHEDSLVQKDIDTAAAIQKSMLPRGKKHMMQLDVDARLLPARKVAGDFYCYLLREGLLYFCIGDVSGKGVPASLFMSKAVTLFRSLASSGLPVGTIAAKMNEELCYNNDQDMFMTGIVGTIDSVSGVVTYVNAGHERPVIWDGNPSSPVEFLSSGGGIPLGVEPNASFDEETFTMGENSLLLLYTDGVSEARSKRGEFLGREMALKLLEKVKTLPCNQINDYVIRTIAEYENGMEQNDDITLLTFRRICTPKNMVIGSEVAQLRKLVPFLREVFSECPMDHKACTQVRTGLDEALTNCVLYAYDAPGGEVSVCAEIAERRLCFTLKDSGKAFNPLEYSSEPSEELSVGGRGISIYKACFDEVLYNREEGFNVLKLIKNL